MLRSSGRIAARTAAIKIVREINMKGIKQQQYLKYKIHVHVYPLPELTLAFASDYFLPLLQYIYYLAGGFSNHTLLFLIFGFFC